jgi:hypothetical protein
MIARIPSKVWRAFPTDRSEEIVLISFEIPNPPNQLLYMKRMTMFSPENNIKWFEHRV